MNSKNKKILIIVVLLIIALAIMAKSITKRKNVSLGEEFILKKGETAVLGNLKVEYVDYTIVPSAISPVLLAKIRVSQQGTNFFTETELSIGGEDAILDKLEFKGYRIILVETFTERTKNNKIALKIEEI